jgi:hypothetical protein
MPKIGESRPAWRYAPNRHIEPKPRPSGITDGRENDRERRVILFRHGPAIARRGWNGVDLATSNPCAERAKPMDGPTRKTIVLASTGLLEQRI